MRIAVGPFTEAYGLRVATSPWSTTPSSPSSGSLSCLPPSSLPRSRLLSFFFFKHFYLPPCRLLLPRPPPSPLCFSLTRLLSSSFSLPSSTLPLLLLLFLALPTTPVEILVYSTLFLLRLDSENQRVVCTVTFSVRTRETWTSLIPRHVQPRESCIYYCVCSLLTVTRVAIINTNLANSA